MNIIGDLFLKWLIYILFKFHSCCACARLIVSFPEYIYVFSGSVYSRDNIYFDCTLSEL